MKNLKIRMKIEKSTEKGITLTTLAVTIIVLLILAGVATATGMEAVDNTKHTKFVAELKIMQSYVNQLYEDCKPNSNETFEGNIESKFTAVNAKNATEDKQAQATLNNANILSAEYGNYYLLQESQKSALGVEGVSQDVLVNVKDRKVVSYYGLKWKNKMYYTIDDQSGDGIGEIYNVEYRNPNTNAPTIAVTGRLVYYGDTAKNAKYRFTVDVTQGSSYINKGDLYYGKIENGNVKTWNKTADNTFLVDREGTYKIYYEDAAGNVSNVEEYIIEPKATLIGGSSFNVKMKVLAGNNSAKVSDEDTNITKFKIASTKPDSSILDENNIVSTASSQYPIYMWFNNGTIYLWSEENWFKISSMANMFRQLKKIENISDLYELYTYNVTSMLNMFYLCNSLISLDISNFNTENVNNMRLMFYNCKNLSELDLSSFNTSKVNNMDNMFSYCSKLSELDLSSFNTENVTNMEKMFNNCKKITVLDLSSFNIDKVTNANQMFYGSEKLKTIYATDYFDLSSLTNNNTYLFYNCTSLVGGAGTTYKNEYHSSTYAHIDGGTSNPGYFTEKNNI